MMQISAAEKFRIFMLHRIPLFTTFCLMFLFFLPIKSVEFNYFRPNIGMICIFYWVLKRSYMFSYFSAFCVGFLIDIYSSSPLGTNMLMALLLVVIVRSFARYFQNNGFSIGWLFFSLIGLCLLVLKWLLLSIYFRHFLPWEEVMLNYISTILCYPFVASFNMWIQNKFLPQERINE